MKSIQKLILKLKLRMLSCLSWLDERIFNHKLYSLCKLISKGYRPLYESALNDSYNKSRYLDSFEHSEHSDPHLKGPIQCEECNIDESNIKNESTN